MLLVYDTLSLTHPFSCLILSYLILLYFLFRFYSNLYHICPQPPLVYVNVFYFLENVYITKTFSSFCIQVFLIYTNGIVLCIFFLLGMFSRVIYVALITSSSLFLTSSQHSIICIITFYLSIISVMDNYGASKCLPSQIVLR